MNSVQEDRLNDRLWDYYSVFCDETLADLLEEAEQDMEWMLAANGIDPKEPGWAALDELRVLIARCCENKKG